MGILDKTIANSVPYMPKSFIQRISCPYVAGHEASDAVRVARDLSTQGCLTTVGVLGEFAPTERYTRERLGDYKRVVDAMEDLRDPNLDYHVTVKLTDLGLTLNEDLCRKNLEKIPSTAIGPIRRRRSAFRGETAGGPYANLPTDIIRRGFHAVVLVTP